MVHGPATSASCAPSGSPISSRRCRNSTVKAFPWRRSLSLDMTCFLPSRGRCTEAPAKVDGAAAWRRGAGDCGEGRPAVLVEDSELDDLRLIYAIENTRSEPGESTARPI